MSKLNIFCVLSLIFIVNTASSAERPNIILIMSDDVGYSDIGCYGGEIETPTLDSLARGGIRFTQFYNTARCCPTRAALLTGLYSHQAGIGHMVDGPGPKTGTAAYSGELSRNAVTIAEVLKQAGYATYMAGKWHVTQKTSPADNNDKANWPRQRGFDRFYGTIHGAGSFFDPNTLVRDNSFISPFADPEYQPEEFYYTDAINDHAVRFVSDHAQQHADQPFFLYVAHTAAHWPMHAKDADIAKYQGKYDAGYDAIRSTRLEKMRQLGLLDQRWKVSPQAGDWSKVENKAWEARCMEVYAAMLDCMDQGIGRLVESLKQNGQYENTLILYLQDNGGCAEGMGRNGAFIARADSPSLPPLGKEYLQPNMIPKQTRDGFPVRQGKGVMPGPADTYIGYGRSWANVSNTPFREYKHWEHEGGISSPLIAHWPHGIPTDAQNRLETQPAHLIDLMATCVDLAGADYPEEFADHQIQPLEGVSLAPAFKSQSLDRSQPLFWEHEGNRAIRMDNWKLVSKHPGGWELYDMNTDRTEQHDLASRYPERVKELAALWDAWAKRVGVLPWPLKVAANKKPLRVFVLAGQSNMEGHARINTLDYLSDDPATLPLLKMMRGADGKPTVCDDAWVSYLTGNGEANWVTSGKLTAGFGSLWGRQPGELGDKIGPEFTFGLTMAEAYDGPILLIKTAWGGKSLHTDYRSPSAGPYELSSFQEEHYPKQEGHGIPKDFAQWKIEKKAATGVYYRLMIEHVKSVLDNLQQTVPDYDPQQGFQLAGFIWFQGFNDMVDGHVYPKHNQADRFELYSSLLTHFIRDVRKDLQTPKLPFVVGVMGVGGLQDDSVDMLAFRKAMAAPAKFAEFEGNVAAVETAPFWSDELGIIDAKRAKINQMRYFLDSKHKDHANADGQMTQEEKNEYLRKYEADLISADEVALWERGASNAGYHYLGCAKTFARMGQAFAEANLRILANEAR